MGGKALKNTYTERKTTAEMHRIYDEITSVIDSKIGVEAHLVEFYRNKETHGDLDILLKIVNPIENLKTFVRENFNPNEIFNNGGVISFDYDNFQVDLIPVRVSEWEATKTFFAWDPTGNLMGKIAHFMGFKYGQRGLVYPMRNFNGRLSHDILLSKDNHKIFKFLGYDYDKYCKGFNTIEEIFSYIIDNKYFDVNKYKIENLTTRDRKRNKKRDSYQKFLKYLTDNNIETTCVTEDREYYLNKSDIFFPDSQILKKIEEFRKIDNENKEISEKFNGHLVMKHFPKLVGKELGTVLNEYKSSMTDFRQFVLDNTSENIIEDFKMWYTVHQNFFHIVYKNKKV